MVSGILDQLSEGGNRILIDQLEGNFCSINLGQSCDLGHQSVKSDGAVAALVPRNIAENAPFAPNCEFRNTPFPKIDRRREGHRLELAGVLAADGAQHLPQLDLHFLKRI